jgi:hypothetical protein
MLGRSLPGQLWAIAANYDWFTHSFNSMSSRLSNNKPISNILDCVHDNEIRVPHSTSLTMATFPMSILERYKAAIGRRIKTIWGVQKVMDPIKQHATPNPPLFDRQKLFFITVLAPHFCPFI